jgi:hypothetical protein
MLYHDLPCWATHIHLTLLSAAGRCRLHLARPPLLPPLPGLLLCAAALPVAWDLSACWVAAQQQEQQQQQQPELVLAAPQGLAPPLQLLTQAPLRLPHDHLHPQLLVVLRAPDSLLPAAALPGCSARSLLQARYCQRPRQRLLWVLPLPEWEV